MCHHQPLKTAVFSHLSSIHPPTHHVFSTFSELGTVLMKKTGKKLYHESHDSLEKVPLPDFFFFFFLAALGLCCCTQAFSLVVASGGYSSLRCTGFSWRWLLLLRSTGSRARGLQ